MLCLTGLGPDAWAADAALPLEPLVPGPSVALPDAASALPALGEPEPVHGASPDTRPLSYVIGVSLNHVPTYSGSNRHTLRPRPMWALQYGRLRISTSGARAVMGFGGDPASGSGASVQIADTGVWRFGASLRLDGGRSSSDDPALAGLPDIRSTLRGRVYADRRWGAAGTLGLGYSQDLLGRSGGGIATAGVGHGWRITDRTDGSIGAGLSAADRTYMQSHYGIPAAAAGTSPYARFEARAGLLDVSAGMGLTTAFTPRWIGFTSAGVGRLLGDAAASPLTRRAGSWRVSVGLAYRCCPP